LKTCSFLDFPPQFRVALPQEDSLAPTTTSTATTAVYCAQPALLPAPALPTIGSSTNPVPTTSPDGPSIICSCCARPSPSNSACPWLSSTPTPVPAPPESAAALCAFGNGPLDGTAEEDEHQKCQHPVAQSLTSRQHRLSAAHATGPLRPSSSPSPAPIRKGH
jgi:hypothetical protein